MALAPIATRAAASASTTPACAPKTRFADLLRDGPPVSRAGSTATSPLRTLESVERAQRRLDDILAQARSGRTFTGGELLALQAEAHRFSHTVEIASKIVEQGAQTVKQAVNTPV
ncbi:MAG TPA: hypothetical protein VFK85_03360 [Anaeromyxobacteraceae bacterium]|nr:hypothetical protein [Anaeromyxobacteraceae bacterium]